MAQRRLQISDGVFWGLMCVVMAGTMGGAIGFVFARFYGAGWLSGAALGAVVFTVAGVILSRAATSTDLPPPNTVKAPVAPPGGAFRAPAAPVRSVPRETTPALVVGRAPAADTNAAAPLAGPTPAATTGETIGQAAGEAVGKALYGASAAVTSAAEAARAALADIVSPGPDPVKPMVLDAPRDGTPDDLKRIKGVGPKLEGMLHGMGCYHFEQIAGWGPAEVAWVDGNLDGFTGRATRDDWVGQARILAAGGTTEHSERVANGEGI